MTSYYLQKTLQALAALFNYIVRESVGEDLSGLSALRLTSRCERESDRVRIDK